MIGVGLATIFLGYTFLTYGWSQLRSCNASLVEIVWPGAFQGCLPDQASAAGTNTTGPIGPSGPVRPNAPPGQIGTNPLKDQPTSSLLPKSLFGQGQG